MAKAKKATTKKKFEFVVKPKAEAKSKKGKLELLTPSKKEVLEAVDKVSEMSQTIKSLDGKMSAYKEIVKNWAAETYAERAIKGKYGNFNIEGDSEVVQYIVSGRASEITEEDKENFLDTYGEKFDPMFEVDYSRYRFNAEFLKEEGNLEKFSKALVALGNDFVERLIVPAGYKPTNGREVIPNLAKLAKKADILSNMITDMKLVAFVKSK